MRPMRCACAFLMAMAMVTACGGDGGDEPTDPGGGPTGGTVTLNATEKNAVAAGLIALATRIGAADADARRFANALAFTVQQAATATEIDVATNLDLMGDEPAPGAAFSTSASASASTALVTRRVLGYSLTVRTDAPGQRTYRGVIVWDAAGLKVIVTVLGNPNVLNVTLPALGNTVYLIGSQTQVWAAMEGNINWTVAPGNSLDCPRPLPNVLSVCGYEDGAAPFAVSSSSPVSFSGNTASGSRTASLGNTRIRVLFINIICGVAGGPC